LAFLRAAVPRACDALVENAENLLHTFSDATRPATDFWDDDRTWKAPECVHVLNPKPPSVSARSGSGSSRPGATRDERFWRDLVPTGVSWNCTGYSIAVSYGRFDVTGWCESPGAVCVWNLRRSDVDERRPDFSFETESCLQCVAFHPKNPAVLCAGSFDGEVYVYDTSGTGSRGGDDDDDARGDARDDDREPKTPKPKSNANFDFLRARSSVSDASHREPVTSIAWLPNAAAAATRFDTSAAYDVCSFGSDGRVLVWDFTRTSRKKIPFPSFGYEVRERANRDASRRPLSIRGCSTASFLADAHAKSNACILGSDDGGVFECLMRHTTGSTAAFSRKCREGETPEMPSPVISEYERHSGATHCVAAHPSEDDLFASCGADGAIKVHHRKSRRTIASLHPKSGGVFCAAWSHSRPSVLAAGTSDGNVALYDVMEGEAFRRRSARGLPFGDAFSAAPIAELRGCDRGTPTQAIAFNAALPEYLAAADGGGVRIWELGARFSEPRGDEARALRGVAARLADPGE